jgi:Zn-dependent protease
VKQSVRLGRVAGIELGAHWSVAVILVLIAELLAVTVLPTAHRHQPAALYWTAASVGAVMFLASLLAHELAHALVARHYGVPVRSITLWMLGGVAELDADPPSAAADLRIALAGPAASIAAGGLFFGAGAAISAVRGPGVAVAAAMWLSVMNGILAVFNLLPGAPLDGGRVLRALLWRHYGNRDRAERGAARAGKVLGAVIFGLGIAELLALRSFNGLWFALIGWFLITAAAAEEKAAAAKAALAGVRVADIMTPEPEIANGWETVAGFAGRVAARSRQDAFPVVGPDAGLIGVVLVSGLALIPAADRDRLRLEQIALPVPPAYRAAPDDAAAPLLTRRPLGGEVAAVVVADGLVVGLVTASDLQRALRWGTLANVGSDPGRR